MRIRVSFADMPFDRRGVYATGREVYRQSLGGVWSWQSEYEDDDTVDLPETDPDYDPYEE